MAYFSRGCVGRTKLGEPELSQKRQTASPTAPPCCLAFCGLLAPCSLLTAPSPCTVSSSSLSNAHVTVLWAGTCVLHCGLLGLSCFYQWLCHSPYGFSPFQSGAVPNGMRCADPGVGYCSPSRRERVALSASTRWPRLKEMGDKCQAG